MDRLTRPDVDTDQTAVRFMDNEVKIQAIGDKLLNLILNGPTINGVNKDTLRHILRQLYAALKPYEDLELKPEEIEHQFMNFSSFLMEMTGGRMSKTNYTLEAMVTQANDCRQKELDSAQQEGYDLGVESVLRHNFDIPWDEAADLRKNIDHLRELLKAEQEGRLVVLPCSIDRPVYLIHQEDGQKRKPKSYSVDECDIDHFTIGETMIPMITAVSKDNEWHELIDGTQEGHEYFLTQEAAEAALAKTQEDNHETTNL